MKPLFLLLGVVVAYFPALCLAEHVDPADKRIAYSGRWDHTNPSTPWCAWQSSALRFKISGTGATAEIESSRVEYVRVIVDNDATRSKKLELDAGKHSYCIASVLSPGQHLIQIVKETYSGPGRMMIHGFDIDGGGLVDLDGWKPRLRIQFYGDSNLAGYSLEHEKNQEGTVWSGCFYTFAGIVSRMLDAEYQNISSSGAVILGQQNSVMSFYDRLDLFQADPKWDFSRFPVDVCVVNIGANDINRRTKQEIKQNYKTLLPVIRKAHPDAHIVVMNGYGWDRQEPANYTREVVEELADKSMSRLAFPWLFNEWHGCEYDHAGMAKSLVNHLATLNSNWKPVRPMDVMDGFGRNGDVANGSFEFVAPCGGFGWRYFQDGALRIHDPEESADGNWFLRIPESKQVHQPKPAKIDRSYTYRLKMRSRDENGKAMIRIEFRDQKWRNEITDAAEEFVFPLTEDWKQYTVDVDAPPGTGDPCQDPWQIIIRIIAKTGTIECDDIRAGFKTLAETR